jgi:alkaline phosphatase
MLKKGLSYILGLSLVITAVFGFDQAGAVNAGKVENVIFLIPDGYSTAQATSYRWYKGSEPILDDHLVGMVKTYSANSEVTDSAAAGTAMATGHKTNNGMISTSPDGKKLKTILEAAKEKGKATGLVATSTITHATPAVFASHVASRANEADIAPQYLGKVDVILGGGKKYFLPKSQGGEQKERNLVEEAKKSGYQLIGNKQQLHIANGNKVLGLFAQDAMAPEMHRSTTQEPSLAEMTKKAIQTLDKSKKGFFLMVEGSQIDWAGHAHDAAWAMKDTAAFELAVKEAIQFAKKDKKTLVIVAGDHETGGLSVGGYGKYDVNLELLRNVKATGDFMAKKLNSDRSNAKSIVKQYANIDITADEEKQIKAAEKPDIAINEIVSKHALVGWTSINHTGVDGPLYAYGPSSTLFRGLHKNTDLPKLMAKAMNVSLK